MRVHRNIEFANRFLVSVLLLCSIPNSALADWFEKGGLYNLSRSSFTDPKDMLHSDFIDPEKKCALGIELLFGCRQAQTALVA